MPYNKRWVRPLLEIGSAKPQARACPSGGEKAASYSIIVGTSCKVNYILLVQTQAEPTRNTRKSWWDAAVTGNRLVIPNEEEQNFWLLLGRTGIGRKK